jgi:hypothetical protein
MHAWTRLRVLQPRTQTELGLTRQTAASIPYLLKTNAELPIGSSGGRIWRDRYAKGDERGLEPLLRGCPS